MASGFRVTAIHGFGSTELRPGVSVGPRILVDWELSLITAGQARWHGGRERIEVKAGDLLLAPPGVRERLVVAEDAVFRHLFVHLLAEGPLESLPRLSPGAGSGIAAPLLRHAIQLASRRQPRCQELAADSLGLLLRVMAVGEFAAPEESPPPLHAAVVAALEHLRLRWRSRLEPVSTAELARAVGVSREHLTRLFRAAFGVGPGQAERLLRLDRAIDWLTDSALPVPEVARRAGWRDAQRFAAALRASCGRGPRELRRAWREGLGVRQVFLSRHPRLRAAAGSALPPP